MNDTTPETKADTGTEAETADALAAVGVLGEPNRRALYDYVCSRASWVSRDEAAEALGLQRPTAVHHLDRLAAEGLLVVSFRRMSGRQGPGAGRPAKLYRRAPQRFTVTIPPRDFELVAGLLVEAVDRARTTPHDLAEAVDDVARSAGRELAASIRERLDTSTAPDLEARRRILVKALAVRGYEPAFQPDGTVLLRNCPFHELARTHTDLVCGINLQLLDAALAELGGTALVARLQPDDASCCVRLVGIEES